MGSRDRGPVEVCRELIVTPSGTGTVRSRAATMFADQRRVYCVGTGVEVTQSEPTVQLELIA